MNTIVAQKKNNIQVFTDFVGRSQLRALQDGCAGEEREYFKELIRKYVGIFTTMPKTYEQDGAGMEAVAYLHYFMGGMDWYITERDIDRDGIGQIQAFGWADLGHGGELGYIDIHKITRHGAELDLFFKPRPLSAMKLNH